MVVALAMIVAAALIARMEKMDSARLSSRPISLRCCLLALRVISRPGNEQVAFVAKRKSDGRQRRQAFAEKELADLAYDLLFVSRTNFRAVEPLPPHRAASDPSRHIAAPRILDR
jgi:hypothetical protein